MRGPGWQLTTLYDDDDLLKCFIRLLDWMSMQYLLAKFNWPILYCMFLLSIYLNLNSLHVFAIYLSKFSQTLCFITYLVSCGHGMFWQTIEEIKCQIFCRGCESFFCIKGWRFWQEQENKTVLLQHSKKYSFVENVD